MLPKFIIGMRWKAKEKFKIIHEGETIEVFTGDIITVRKIENGEPYFSINMGRTMRKLNIAEFMTKLIGV